MTIQYLNAVGTYLQRKQASIHSTFVAYYNALEPFRAAAPHRLLNNNLPSPRSRWNHVSETEEDVGFVPRMHFS